MSVSLKQIRYFIAAAESGQISHAAVELNVSQSAVTAAIQQLEAILGVRLFDRHPGGVSLTPEGSRFLLHGRNVMAAVEEAMRVPRTSNASASGTVRVGVTYTVAGYFLPRHHARFARNFPNVTLDLYEASRSVIEQALIDGALDIAVMLVSNLEARDRIQSEMLMRSRRRLWTPPDHPLLREPSVGLAQVAEHPYVMLTVDEASHTAGRYWSRTTHRPNVIFRTSSVEAVRSMVAAGMGVTILSDMVFRPWSLEGQRIETRLLEDEIPTMDVGLAWKRDAALSPATRAFQEFLSLAYTGGGQALTE
ncbi:LysR substrate-binding domain-containing protein [Chthonobacter rhizosphaerae]|uniref:LysR substrate-binding domain-containing protein n=1 Tax=Chthonobacter rhizosphaerae TaxID=2735553 RepID=UPI0015EF59A0